MRHQAQAIKKSLLWRLAPAVAPVSAPSPLNAHLLAPFCSGRAQRSVFKLARDATL
jgi:hypothetical protein